jgi:hypothetical protein|tara:strand:+ start:319 stop:510 length:192 start_codon:yes stop_codon:yes gene_type:complete
MTPQKTKTEIDMICKRKYRHTNWAIKGTCTFEELQVNEIAHVDNEEGIIYFKNKEFNVSRSIL